MLYAHPLQCSRHPPPRLPWNTPLSTVPKHHPPARLRLLTSTPLVAYTHITACRMYHHPVVVIRYTVRRYTDATRYTVPRRTDAANESHLLPRRHHPADAAFHVQGATASPEPSPPSAPERGSFSVPIGTVGGKLRVIAPAWSESDGTIRQRSVYRYGQSWYGSETGTALKSLGSYESPSIQLNEFHMNSRTPQKFRPRECDSQSCWIKKLKFHTNPESL